MATRAPEEAERISEAGSVGPKKEECDTLHLGRIFLPTHPRDPDDDPDDNQYSDGYYHEPYQHCSKDYRDKKPYYQKDG
jgi:hypothetical protein